MGNILVSGSTAYDYIMDYKDNFSNHIRKDNIHKLSVSFIIDEMKKEKGGTGLNIAYNLALLGENPILYSSIGKDFDFGDFIKNNVNLKYIYTSEDLLSSSGYITNDLEENQITAFYPGAMLQADNVSINEVEEKINYAIVSPNKKEAMIMHLKELHTLGVKTFFDPGQAIGMMTKEDLLKSADYANYLIVNDYEFELFKETICLSKSDIISLFDKVIITLGSKGSAIIDGKREIFIPAVKNDKVLDPTGAGDAYRAGLIKGLNSGFDWELSGKIGSLLASVSVSYYGGQNHFINYDDFKKLFKKEFGELI
ncbi:carbohydrate kinase family protein [Candidatus Gracilibacteria bacterium]|nr:MAG: carbohydrate kinase family protein [Candidatus Gracilibacteria bacterium]